jgi:hypothetical protein
MVAARNCRLEEILGRTKVCHAEACPFWERGSSPAAAHCAFEGAVLGDNPDLAEWLLRVRGILEEEKNK